jgi:hypothetical protein
MFGIVKGRCSWYIIFVEGQKKFLIETIPQFSKAGRIFPNIAVRTYGSGVVKTLPFLNYLLLPDRIIRGQARKGSFGERHFR